MPRQQTYIMLKPDAIRRGLIGQIISRIENKGFQIKRAEMMTLSEEMIKEHCSHLRDKPFFPELAAYMTSGPVLSMVVEGEEAILAMRQLMGPTNVFEAQPGSIRGDYAHSMTENIIHGSDSPENAAIEIKRFFGDSNL